MGSMFSSSIEAEAVKIIVAPLLAAAKVEGQVLLQEAVAEAKADVTKALLAEIQTLQGQLGVLSARLQS